MTGGRRGRPWQCAAALTLSYLLLSVAWAFTNPPGAAPDEADHFTKALGSGTFQIGRAAPDLPPDALPSVETRNQSITRYYAIPSRLQVGPEYRCFARDLDKTAACLPDTYPRDVGNVEVGTPIGAYPPFLYAPVGWAALLAPTPYTGIVAARLAVSVLSAGLLFLGVWHAVRWLGRPAILGVVVALTPMAVFATAAVSMSAIEIMAAVAVACVVVVAAVKPDSVLKPATHLTLAAAGSVLALSRQLGVVALAVMLLALLVVAGKDRLRRLFGGRQLTFWLAVASIGVSTAAMVWWERRFDHPAFAQFAFTELSLRRFVEGAGSTVESGIARFGWLDSPVPGALIVLWIALWGLVVGLGVMVASRRDTWIMLASFAAMVVLAYYVYVAVFFTVDASIQGRHFLGIAAFVTLLAAANVTKRLRPVLPGALRRLHLGVGLFVPVAHVFAIYWNARRYAVGSSGLLWFLPDAEWSPPFGYAPWLLVGLLGAVLLSVITVRSHSRVGPVSGKVDENRAQRQVPGGHPSDV